MRSSTRSTPSATPSGTTSRSSRSGSIKAALAGLAMLAAFAAAAREQAPGLLFLPGTPVSHAVGEFAPLVNPVFSDLPAASSLAYRRTIYNDGGGAGHHAALNALGFTLAWSRVDTLYSPETESFDDTGSRFYSAGRGFFSATPSASARCTPRAAAAFTMTTDPGRWACC